MDICIFKLKWGVVISSQMKLRSDKTRIYVPPRKILVFTECRILGEDLTINHDA